MNAKALMNNIIRKIKFRLSPQRIDSWAGRSEASEKKRLEDWALYVTGALNDMPAAMDQYFANTYGKQLVDTH
eukprot:12087097-Alexandrium_andersonii.AAC.1